MCNQCDDAPCVAKGGGAVTKRADGIVHHRSREGEGPQGPRRRLSLRPHLVERGASGAAGVQLRRPSHRPGLAADPRPPVVPDRRDARDLGRGRGDGAHGAGRGPRGDAARARHQAARLLPQPLALFEMLHRRLGVGGGERRRRLRRGRDGAPAPERPAGRGDARATTTATSNSTSSTRIPAPMSSRSRPPATRRRRSRRSSASASISARSGCKFCRHSGGASSQSGLVARASRRPRDMVRLLGFTSCDVD